MTPDLGATPRPVYRVRVELAAWLLDCSVRQLGRLVERKKLTGHTTQRDDGVPGTIELIDANELADFAGCYSPTDIQWLSEWRDARRRGDSNPFAFNVINMLVNRNMAERAVERQDVEARHRRELDDVIEKSLHDAEVIRAAYDVQIEAYERVAKQRAIQVDVLTRANEALEEQVAADRQTKIMLCFSGLVLAGMAVFGAVL